MKTADAVATQLMVYCPHCHEAIPAPRSRAFVWSRPDAIRAVAAKRIRCDDCDESMRVPALVRGLANV